jgi:hypothetical protein
MVMRGGASVTRGGRRIIGVVPVDRRGRLGRESAGGGGGGSVGGLLGGVTSVGEDAADITSGGGAS